MENFFKEFKRKMVLLTLRTQPQSFKESKYHKNQKSSISTKIHIDFFDLKTPIGVKILKTLLALLKKGVFFKAKNHMKCSKKHMKKPQKK